MGNEFTILTIIIASMLVALAFKVSETQPVEAKRDPYTIDYRTVGKHEFIIFNYYANGSGGVGISALHNPECTAYHPASKQF
jgi:hypothetical protein